MEILQRIRSAGSFRKMQGDFCGFLFSNVKVKGIEADERRVEPS